MSTANVIGKVQVALGDVKIVAVDGTVRDAGYGDLVYEGEQIVSNDPETLFQIHYSTLPEATSYTGIFKVLADGSLIAETDVNLVEEDVDIFETAAGEEGIESNSQNIEDNPEAIDYVQTFGRSDNTSPYFDETNIGDIKQEGEGDALVGVDEDTPPEDTPPEDTPPEDTPPEDTPPEDTPPEALSETVTKVADYIPIEGDDVRMIVSAINEPGSERYELFPTGNGWYGIDDTKENDPKPMIDSHGVNEGIKFSLEGGEASSATVEFKNINDNVNENDAVSIKLYMGGEEVATVDTSSISNGSFLIDEGVAFDEIQIFALDTGTEAPPTEFKVSAVDATTIDYIPTVLDFVIDDAMLLANDTDMQGDSLEVQLTDGKLMASDGVTQVGTVSIIDGGDNDGDIQVTTFDHADEYEDGETLTFSYVVSDGTDTSNVAIAAINVQHDADADVGSTTGVDYDQTTGEFIIGTDTGNEALSHNVLTVSDSLDLSNVSNIEVVQLDEDATVTGIGDLNGITASDVMNATDDGTLIINSLGDADPGTINIDVDHTSGSLTLLEPGDVGYDPGFNTYTDGTATLLVDIDIPIEVV